MKKIICSIFFASILLAGCGGNSGQKMKGDGAIDVTPDKLAIKLDPVCQMPLDQHPIADTMSYSGKLYGFCSPGCKEAFAAEPDKFLSALPK